MPQSFDKPDDLSDGEWEEMGGLPRGKKVWPDEVGISFGAVRHLVRRNNEAARLLNAFLAASVDETELTRKARKFVNDPREPR